MSTDPHTKRASPTVAITGANGLVGHALVERFAAAGWHVRALVRDIEMARVSMPGVELRAIDLPARLEDDVFAGVDAVIYAAYATRTRDRATATRVNEDGTARIVTAARDAGVRKFVFISSLASNTRAVSYYGRSKAACEARLDHERDLIVRPGLVLARHAGLASRLWNLAKAFPIIPIVGATQNLQTVHIDDLAAVVERAVALDISGVLTVAESTGITLRDLVQAMGAASGRNPVLVSLPTMPVRWSLQTLETLRVPLPVTTENLDGLFAVAHAEPSPRLADLGVRIRTARESIAALSAAGRA